MTLQNSEQDPSFQPTLQVINVKKVNNNTSNQDRFRLILSDGVKFMQGLLATQSNDLVYDTSWKTTPSLNSKNSSRMKSLVAVWWSV